MDMGLRDKVVVITGASKGIGLAMTEAFAGEGARVIAGSRTKGEGLSRLSRAYPVLPVAVDLGAPEGPAELVGRAVEKFGGVDVLINNVGAITPRGGFLSVEDEDWRWAIEMNLMTAVRASRAALPVMLERGGGAIVNVSTVLARQPAPPMVDYSASKAALSNLTKTLAEEFGPRGVRVTAVSPGPVRTPLWTDEGAMADAMAAMAGISKEEAISEGIPQSMNVTLGRMGEAAEIAALVLFLASERASYVAGSEHLVDGGMLKSL